MEEQLKVRDEKAHVAVFTSRDDETRKFIIPGYWYGAGSENDPSDVMVSAMLASVSFNLSHEFAEMEVAEGEGGRLLVKHAAGVLMSRALEHGAIAVLFIDVLFIAGPEFDTAVAEDAEDAAWDNTDRPIVSPDCGEHGD